MDKTNSDIEKKLLVICDMFTPPAFLPRVRFFCDYLQQHGWNIDILTETPRTQTILPYNIYSLTFCQHNRIGGNVEWAMKTIISLFCDIKSRQFVKYANKSLNLKHYKAILCSTFFTFPLPVAAQLAKQWQIPWIADLRDIAEQAPRYTYLEHQPKGWFGNIMMQRYTQTNIKRRNNALEQANSIITISPWHTEFLKKFNSNTHTIFNGYDANIFKNDRQATNQFVICYTGKYYGKPLQDITDLLTTLYELVFLQKQISEQKILFKWFSDDASKQRLLKTIDQQHYSELLKIIAFSPLIPHEKIAETLNTSSIALIASNTATNNGNHGIMTTKFYEALGCECPVLCVKSDNECLADAIKKTNIGIAAENVADCKQFILNKYNEWETNKFTMVNVNKVEQQKYTRQHQAKQLYNILSTLTN
ncbi:MAG: hypothetical protein Q4D14_01620 [Bacteroidales bacterium]|nr:hypothetical protein [Bacteroidales bacterium]